MIEWSSGGHRAVIRWLFIGVHRVVIVTSFSKIGPRPRKSTPTPPMPPPPSSSRLVSVSPAGAPVDTPRMRTCAETARDRARCALDLVGISPVSRHLTASKGQTALVATMTAIALVIARS